MSSLPAPLETSRGVEADQEDRGENVETSGSYGIYDVQEVTNTSSATEPISRKLSAVAPELVGGAAKLVSNLVLNNVAEKVREDAENIIEDLELPPLQLTQKEVEQKFRKYFGYLH